MRLLVTNDCTASESFDPEKVFERFYRSNKARTFDGSCELGLSIAKSVVEMHKGEIRAEVSEHNRVWFEAVFPKGKSNTPL